MAIYSATSKIDQRKNVTSFILKREVKTVIDVGGARNAWAYESIKEAVNYTVLDMKKPDVDCEWIQADLDNAFTWKPLLDRVKSGKFDFLICTQTLEHLGNVSQSLSMFSNIAKEGFISVPNKRVELTKRVAFGDEGLIRCKMLGHFRGFAPHKWIFTIINHKEGFLQLKAFPKLSFIEYDTTLFDMMKTWDIGDMELSFWWKDNIPNHSASDLLIGGPDPQAAIEYFREFIKEGI